MDVINYCDHFCTSSECYERDIAVIEKWNIKMSSGWTIINAPISPMLGKSIAYY
jgi:hypothetical protein